MASTSARSRCVCEIRCSTSSTSDSTSVKRRSCSAQRRPWGAARWDSLTCLSTLTRRNWSRTAWRRSRRESSVQWRSLMRKVRDPTDWLMTEIPFHFFMDECVHVCFRKWRSQTGRVGAECRRESLAERGVPQSNASALPGWQRWLQLQVKS